MYLLTYMLYLFYLCDIRVIEIEQVNYNIILFTYTTILILSLCLHVIDI